MTLYHGRLLDGIEAYLTASSNTKFALLIIDEQGENRAAGELLAAMLRTISYAVARSFKIVLVEINRSMLPNDRQPTRAAFMAHLPPHTTLYKKGWNAFAVQDGSGEAKPETGIYSSSFLDGDLRTSGVNELLVLGRTGTQCVRLTVTGGREKRQDTAPEYKGALGYGYQVWTSQKIVEGDIGGWSGTKGVKCYDDV
jgi:hypothetical protein